METLCTFALRLIAGSRGISSVKVVDFKRQSLLNCTIWCGSPVCVGSHCNCVDCINFLPAGMKVPVVMAVCSKTLFAAWNPIKWLFCLHRCSPHRFVISWFTVFIQIRPFRTPCIGGPLDTGVMVDQTRLGQQIGDTDVRNDCLETITQATSLDFVANEHADVF